MPAQFVALRGVVRLGPESAVHQVEDGLLLCGPIATATIPCGPAVAQVWASLRPRLTAGFDIGELTGPGAPAVATIALRLVHRLADAGMLTAETSVPAVALTGSVSWLAGLESALCAAGVRSAAPARIRITATHSPAGEQKFLVELGQPDELAVRWLGAADPPCPLLDDAATVLTGMVELLVRHAKGARLPARTVVVDESGISRVETVAPGELPVLPRRDDRLLASLVHRLVDVPGGTWSSSGTDELPQRPLARWLLSSARTKHLGVGIDRAAATMDAVFGAVRAEPAEGHSVAAAGYGLVDVFADGLGRLLVQRESGNDLQRLPLEPIDGFAEHWLHTLPGEPALYATTSAAFPALTVVKARNEQSSAWGYGATRADAVEHALRGLLRGGTAAVPVSHHADAGATLVAAATGCGAAATEAELAEALAARLPGLRARIAPALTLPLPGLLSARFGCR